MTYASKAVTDGHDEDTERDDDARNLRAAAPPPEARARKPAAKSPRQEALERQRCALTDKLRAMFDEVAAEPLPASFEDLLSQLDDETPKGPETS